MTKRNAGWALVGIGLFLIFRMVRVSYFGFFRIGKVNTASIVLMLLIISAIAVVVNRNKYTVGCFAVCLCMLVAALILGTNLSFGYASLLDVLLGFAPLIAGIGLLIKDKRDKNHS